MSILVTLLVGLVVGIIAKLVVPGRDPGGAVITILLGVGGAFVAGIVGHALGWYEVGEGPGIVASVIGAAILLSTYRVIAGRRSW
ncbi:MAG TPA: GlsB/YeaQ/YmgE family stress response membrane protein [Kofleriaceae bacterium]|nr:GlsB/YeaQ/YmgE family stress response membrane protein [Kofleriaceae bacterium]